MYAVFPLDAELDPEEDDDEFDELSELASEVELFEQPIAARLTINMDRSNMRIADMAMNSSSGLFFAVELSRPGAVGRNRAVALGKCR